MHNNMNVSVSGPAQPTSTYKTVVLKGQNPFASQIIEPNTKYVIKHNFVLNGDVTIPENCILEFDGGSIDGDFKLILNKTRVINISKDFIKCGVVGWFYDINYTRLSNQTFKKHNNKIDIIVPISPWGSEWVDIWADNMVYMDAINGQIIINVVYNSTTHICNFDSRYSSLFNIDDMFERINQRGIEIHSLKFHKSTGFTDNPDTYETSAYVSFVENTINTFENKTSFLDSIFISNEEPNRTAEGNSWNDAHIELSSWIHAKNLKVGISTHRFDYTFETISQDLLAVIDIVGMNFYPTISFKKNNTEFYDIQQMINLTSLVLRNHLEYVIKKVPIEKIIISECGCSNKIDSLEFPEDYTRPREGVDETGKLRAIFYATTIGATKLQNIKTFTLWYVENSMLQEHIKNVFYNEQFK